MFKWDIQLLTFSFPLWGMMFLSCFCMSHWREHVLLLEFDVVISVQSLEQNENLRSHLHLTSRSESPIHPDCSESSHIRCHSSCNKPCCVCLLLKKHMKWLVHVYHKTHKPNIILTTLLKCLLFKGGGRVQDRLVSSIMLWPSEHFVVEVYSPRTPSELGRNDE